MKEYILRLCVGLVILLPTIGFAQVEDWVRRYNGPGNSFDWANAIALDNSGNVYVTGISQDSGTGRDYATVKYDSSGVEQWVATYNGPGNSSDGAYAIGLDNLGNVYVTGVSEGSGTGSDYATVKYNSSGVEQWVARYNGPANSYDVAYAIAVDNLGNIYVTGSSEASGLDNYDYATIKYNALGVEQWVARYDTSGGTWDDAYAIALDNAGNVYVTGKSISARGFGYVTVKYDSSGVEQWVARYNGPGNSNDVALAIALDNAGNVYVTGASWGSGTGHDYATIKYSSTGIAEKIATSVENNYLGSTIFSGPLLLPEGKKCKVFDITGRVVEPDRIQPGIYFIEIDGKVAQKVIKIR